MIASRKPGRILRGDDTNLILRNVSGIRQRLKKEKTICKSLKDVANTAKTNKYIQLLIIFTQERVYASFFLTLDDHVSNNIETEFSKTSIFTPT